MTKHAWLIEDVPDDLRRTVTGLAWDRHEACSPWRESPG